MSRQLLQPLVSNKYTLSPAPDRLGWLTPTDPNQPIADLKAQYQNQGYLWLKNILDREEILGFRRRYFEAFQDSGLLVPGTDAVDGIFAPDTPVKGNTRQILNEIVRWAAYEALCLSKAIWGFYEKFLGGPVYLHKRKIIRHTKPGDPSSTGAHYDLVYLRAGTDKVVTSWLPLGDTPVEMGGLVYLEGSDAWGRQMEAEFAQKNAALSPEERVSAYNAHMAENGWLTKDLPSLAERLNTRWLAADYEAGDMVIHSAYMIHAATMNNDPQNRMRLSTDIRYQLIQESIDPRWNEHWSPDDNL